ncbi:TetR/AcrR family transcriptional regulator [Actinomadura madurae]|uniref:TetR/AcrR family transcriptional regulator n=1 Tax=Actinomadura madurae TaxID=1993 RepID=UPI0020275FD5|nr:TetR/AcrR family transcriptional regulator [Actinomadura madurae]MCP9954044.1 TetR/AcrR family transcriptional regulator [Actinomadura madurae]MCP9970782.1 TetR/AcrR family transcriptional regulator [Actinomadura madurae]MCP9983261.1 TetR/AcrR family transcriptional regulator [Actinomadura madurae]MCQ0005181.1 TetR/AcrR family transcriptional regulator [Actinomadura madurae]MCQ0019506.1 TetR/AcrR family transcriptional regulator [Actinomadura madurae]
MTLDATLRERLAAPEADAGGLDARILDAALAEFESYGLRRVSVEDVAKRAGVARTTIYRRFAGKDQLLQAVILRECRRFLTAIAEATEGLPSPEDAVVEGFAVGLRSARAHPLLARVLESEPEAFLPQLSMNGGAVMLAARDILADRLRRARPGDAEDHDTVAEVLLRVAVSLLLVPGGGLALDDEDAIRRFARDYLTRMLRPGNG